jgi:hypothetical protein
MTSAPLAEDVRDMFAVHKAFRREFGLIPGLVRAVPAYDKPRTTIVANHVDLMSKLVALHHSEEDKHIWPRLRERGTDEMVTIVSLMEEEHKTIHESLLHVADALESWRQSALTQARDALADRIDQLLPLLNDHLSDEEKCAVPLIQKCITEAEYGVIPAETAASLGPDQFSLLFGMVLLETAPEVIDAIVSHMPAPAREGIRNVSAKKYAAYTKELYGTATPPGATASVRA